MLHAEIIAVCSQIHTKHINTLCGQNVELLNVKLVVHIVTTGVQSFKYVQNWKTQALRTLLITLLHMRMTGVCKTVATFYTFCDVSNFYIWNHSVSPQQTVLLIASHSVSPQQTVLLIASHSVSPQYTVLLAASHTVSPQ